MMIDPKYDVLFLKAVQAARPYLNQLVFVGGCASALYRCHSASAPSLIPMVTRDVDIAGQEGLAVAENASPLAERMEEAGFRKKYYGRDTHPVVKYVPGEGGVGFDVEFLCPLLGSRGGKKNPSVPLQDGLMAQPLRYLEVLLINPWQVNLAEANLAADLPEGELRVRIPNPAAYVVQKMLIRSRRDTDSRRKDCYYIYEIAVTFRRAIERVRSEFDAMKKQVHPKWLDTFRRNFEKAFADASAEGPQSAVMIHQASPDHVEDAKRRNFIINEEAVCRTVQTFSEALGL